MSRARPISGQVDLLHWADIDDARADVERAEELRNAAARRYHYAPIGTRNARLKTFLEATQDALKAEGRLRRLLREAGHG